MSIRHWPTIDQFIASRRVKGFGRDLAAFTTRLMSQAVRLVALSPTRIARGDSAAAVLFAILQRHGGVFDTLHKGKKCRGLQALVVVR